MPGAFQPPFSKPPPRLMSCVKDLTAADGSRTALTTVQ
jgi:hypothetical protein